MLSTHKQVPASYYLRACCYLLVWLLLLGVHADAANKPGSKPNILFIAIDDMNDWFGCLGGHPQVKTPNIDRLAGRGTVFLNAHCQSPLCNPSRTSLLTGLRPSTTGIYALNPWFRSAPQYKNLVALPQYFMKNGYRTLTTGKIYHDAYPPKADRVDGPEFSVWGYLGDYGPYPAKKFVNTPDKMKAVDWGVFPERDELQEDYKVADWAVQRMGTLPKTEPFMLCVGFRRPHVPCFATQKWFDLYPEETLQMPPVKRDDRDDTPRFSWYLHWKLPEPRLAWLEANNQWKPLVRSYLASISFMDSQVGRVLEALEKGGFADNTLVVIWGDNGWHLGEKLITGKNSLWDRSTRVPLIFAGPGVKAGGRTQQPAELLDIYPTLVDLCGLPVNNNLEGHSLRPQLEKANAKRKWPAITTHGPNNHGIRTDKWRYIRYADGSEELYDMIADAAEWTNLAADPKFAKVKKELAQWLPQVNAAPMPGSSVRLIEWINGIPFWELKPIGNEPPPMD